MAPSAQARERVVDWIAGAVNFRDFGGYPTIDGGMVHTGMLFRSGFTHGISEAGVATIAQEIGIRTVVDLRTETERGHGLSSFDEHGIRAVHEPLITSLGSSPGLSMLRAVREMAHGDFDWVALYWSMLTLNRDQFKHILELLAEPDALPALVHCTGGRDRTGLTVALIQAALGVVDEHIAADYALSSALLFNGPPNPEFERLFSKLDLPREVIARALATLPRTMLEVMARIRSKYGTVDQLLASWGLDQTLLQQLRARLIERN